MEQATFPRTQVNRSYRSAVAPIYFAGTFEMNFIAKRDSSTSC